MIHLFLWTTAPGIAEAMASSRASSSYGRLQQSYGKSSQRALPGKAQGCVRSDTNLRSYIKSTYYTFWLATRAAKIALDHWL